jgi:hypothetical protein
LTDLIERALAGEFRIEEMGPHFTKFFLPDWRVVHRFTAPDHAIHDHPWSFTSTILRGGYVEMVFSPEGVPTTHHRRPGETHHVPADTIHSITGLPDGECWTLIEPGHWERHTRFYRHTETGEFVSRLWNENWND